MLAMLVCLIVACGLALDDVDRRPVVSAPVRSGILAVVVLLSVGQVFSFVWVLRRYTVGVDGWLREMIHTAQWEPPLGWIALSGLLFVVVTVVGWITYRAATADAPG